MGRKRLKNVVKIIEKFQNLLEVHIWYGNKSVGQFRGENQIHELFSHFDPFPSILKFGFFLSSIGKLPLNRLVIAYRSFL